MCGGGKSGWESPALGVWTTAVSLLGGAGLILLMLGLRDLEPAKGFPGSEANIVYSAIWMGGIMLFLALAVAVFAALAFFVSSCFQLGLCVMSVVVGIVSVSIGIACGVGVASAHSLKKCIFFHTNTNDALVDCLREADAGIEMEFCFYNSGMLLLVAIMAMGAFVTAIRARSVGNDDPIAETMLYTGSACLGVMLGVGLLVGGYGVETMMWLGGSWLLVSIILAIAINMVKCCLSPKICHLLVAAALTLSLCLSLATVILGMRDLVKGQATFYTPSANTPTETWEAVAPFYAMCTGTHPTGAWLRNLLCLSMGNAFATFAAAVFAVRQTLWCLGKSEYEDQ
eukprot:GHVT01081644.1.p1 GENE.GHVT01081644.1~~GHVT01081644.1.p1  ORF type:complete len:342 (+),score=61.43 GHVT01081644.1:165-1190(+)